MKKLSVVLATFNEEKNIVRCLKSVQSIADEIVIVDGTSTDDTVKLAKELGADVSVTTNPTNFHINKQKAIDKASGEWILQLDADEVVSKALVEEIREKIENWKMSLGPSAQSVGGENGKLTVNGYWMPRKNYFLGRFLMKGGQYPDYTIRLYRRGKGRLPQKDVHEQAVIEGAVGYLDHALLHYPYKDFGAYIKKWTKYNHFFAYQIRDELHHKSFIPKILYGIGYMVIKPSHWFLTTYFRHKGFLDGWQGFVFSLFSALRFVVSYWYYITGNTAKE